MLTALLVLSCQPVWCQQELAEFSVDIDVAQFSADEDVAHVNLLLDGRRLVDAGQPREAITEYFDKVLSEYEAKYGNSEERIYCARTSTESFAYLLTAAAEEQEAFVLSETWANAHLMKGYALLELGRMSEGKSSIEQALTLSPYNSQYLSELAYVYQIEKNWPAALKYFQDAERFAEGFTPDNDKAFELAIARRGLGYVLVELGRLDEAEEKYRQCLAADPNDVKAKNELAYVLDLQKAEGAD